MFTYHHSLESRAALKTVPVAAIVEVKDPMTLQVTTMRPLHFITIVLDQMYSPNFTMHYHAVTVMGPVIVDNHSADYRTSIYSNLSPEILAIHRRPEKPQGKPAESRNHCDRF